MSSEVCQMDSIGEQQLSTSSVREKRYDSKTPERRSVEGEVHHSSRLYDRFEWTIHDVFMKMNRGQLYSPEFQSDGALWRMALSTKSSTNNSVCYVDLQLWRSPPSAGARYQAKLGVKKSNGRDCQKVCHETDLDGFMEVHKLLIWPQKALTSGSAKFISGGRLIIFCELSLSEKGREEPPKMSTQAYSDSSLLVENLRDLLSSGANSDVELNVGGKAFKVHKAIVCARCPVFSSMFQHDMSEKKSGIVEITDCSADAFAVFLRYLYTGETEAVQAADSALVCNLYYIADKYNVQELKGQCSGRLMDNLSVENFCDVVALSLRHNESSLLKAACEFFTRNVKAIITTARWQTYLTENPIHANELYIKAIDAQPAERRV